MFNVGCVCVCDLALLTQVVEKCFLFPVAFPLNLSYPTKAGRLLEVDKET